MKTNITSHPKTKYGKLVVVEAQRCVWECQCECGRRVLARPHHIKKGKITHCGCEGELGARPLLRITPRDMVEEETLTQEERMR